MVVVATDGDWQSFLASKNVTNWGSTTTQEAKVLLAGFLATIGREVSADKIAQSLTGALHYDSDGVEYVQCGTCCHSFSVRVSRKGEMTECVDRQTYGP